MQRIKLKDVPKEMVDHLMTIENFINKSSIDRSLLELIRLRVAQINGCAYCLDMHHKELKNLNESDLRLSSLCVWEETNYFSEKEMKVLLFTENLTKLSAGPISDKVYDPLLLFFSKEEISYLTLAVAQINTWTRLMKTFRFVPGYHKVQNNGEPI